MCGIETEQAVPRPSDARGPGNGRPDAASAGGAKTDEVCPPASGSTSRNRLRGLEAIPSFPLLERQIGTIAGHFAREGTCLYQLGCGAGDMLLNVDRAVDPRVRFVGVDGAVDELIDAALRLEAGGVARLYDLVAAEPVLPGVVSNASVVIMLGELGRVAPPMRRSMIETVASGVLRDGCLILCDHFEAATPAAASLIGQLAAMSLSIEAGLPPAAGHQAYGLGEILCPVDEAVLRRDLHAAGFALVERFHQWYGVQGLLAVKAG